MGAADQNYPQEPLIDEPTLPSSEQQSATGHNDQQNSVGERDEDSRGSRRGRRLSMTIGENLMEDGKRDGNLSSPKRGLGPRTVGGSEKLGMFSGVFVPTCLNVLSILMFLRFGFILGMPYCVLHYLFRVQY